MTKQSNVALLFGLALVMAGVGIRASRDYVAGDTTRAAIEFALVMLGAAVLALRLRK